MLSPEAALDKSKLTGDDARKCIVRLQSSIRAYALAVMFAAEIVSLYKLIPWAIRTYHP
jgi:hypothetical protein